jgi:hypothetical protein
MSDCQLLVKTLLYLQLAIDRTWLLLIGAAILSTCCIKLSREIKFAWKVAKRYWNDFPLFDHQQWVLKNIRWVGGFHDKGSQLLHKNRGWKKLCTMYKNVATQKLHWLQCTKYNSTRYVEDILWRNLCGIWFGSLLNILFVWIITSRKVKNRVAHDSNEQQIQAASELGVQWRECVWLTSCSLMQS